MFKVGDMVRVDNYSGSSKLEKLLVGRVGTVKMSSSSHDFLWVNIPSLNDDYPCHPNELEHYSPPDGGMNLRDILAAAIESAQEEKERTYIIGKMKDGRIIFGTNPSPYVHTSYREAEEELKRLSLAHMDTQYIIFEAVAECKVETPKAKVKKL